MKDKKVALSPGRLTDTQLARIAEVELNESPADRHQKIQAFREAVSSVPNLKSRTDDFFLLRFLRARKFDQERALELLKNYYRQRIKYPELYKKLEVSSIPHVLVEPLYGVLPHKDPQGRTIIVNNSVELWDPSTVHLNDLIRYWLLSMECVIDQDDAQICGVVSLIDNKGVGLRHYLSYTPFMLAKMVSVTFNSFPMRIREVHIINSSKVARLVYNNMVRPLLSQKLKNRIWFHGDDLNSLHQRIPAEILPAEFGGLCGPFSNTEWNKILVDHDGTMKENCNYGYTSNEL